MGRVSDLLPSVESFEIGLEKDKKTIYIEWRFNTTGDFDDDLMSAVSDGALITVWIDKAHWFSVQCSDCEVVECDGSVTITCHHLMVNFFSEMKDRCGMWVGDDVFCDLCYESIFGSFSTIDIYLGEYARKMAVEYGIL